jgi:ABC-type transporter Mla subunit MlaD
MRADLRKSLQELPATLNEVRVTLGKANDAFDGFKTVSDRASRNLENLENLTKPLGERGQQIVDNLDGSLANINELLEQLAARTFDGDRASNVRLIEQYLAAWPARGGPAATAAQGMTETATANA